MITGIHALMYAENEHKARAFFRDVLGLPNVDAGSGWLIFKLPPSELAVHEAYQSGTHELYLMCDNLAQTMADLTAKGVEFGAPVTEAPWGRLTSIRVPGGGDIRLYEPKHKTAYDL
jgi:catechol 2,3-dioxygenase-like lactoylglutathione lyase family enzyme